MKLSQRGFTSVELIVVIVLAAFVAGLFWVQKTDIDARGRDSLRKQHINAIHYYLEGVVYPAQKGYPATLNADALKGLDPAALKDTEGRTIGDKSSDYIYEATDCHDGICSGYKLTAILQKEAMFVKSNAN